MQLDRQPQRTNCTSNTMNRRQLHPLNCNNRWCSLSCDRVPLSRHHFRKCCRFHLKCRFRSLYSGWYFCHCACDVCFASVIVDGTTSLCNCYSCCAPGCCASAVNVISMNDPSIRTSTGTIVVANFVYCICARHSFLLDYWPNLLDSEVVVAEAMSMHRNCCTFAYYRISD